MKKIKVKIFFFLVSQINKIQKLYLAYNPLKWFTINETEIFIT